MVAYLNNGCDYVTPVLIVHLETKMTARR